MKQMLSLLWNDPKAVRKFIVALLAAVGVAVSVGLLPASIAGWAAVGSAFVGALGVYGLHNGPVKKVGNRGRNQPNR